MDDSGCRWTVWEGNGKTPGLAAKGVARPEDGCPGRNGRASALASRRHGRGRQRGPHVPPSHHSNRLGHRRRPWRLRCRHGEGRPIGAGKPGPERPRNDRRFPPLGGKAVSSYPRATEQDQAARPGGACIQQPQRFSLRGRPSLLWFGTFPKRRIRRWTTRISHVCCGKAKRGCASRVPPSPGVVARRTRGGAGGESDPTFFGADAPSGSVHRRVQRRAINTPLQGSLSPQ